MWLMAKYQPVALFSLKSALATSSGGKSLLLPTPFALKMALLDAAYRVWGINQVADVWPTLRDLQVAMALSQRLVVTNLFTKILKPRRGKPKPGTADAGPFQKTIAFREYVWPVGNWQLALGIQSPSDIPRLVELLSQVNYLGKRGGFVQLVNLPEQQTVLPNEFLRLNPPEAQTMFDYQGVLQVLDDCGPKMRLEHADIYSGKRIRLGKERILHHIVLPYRALRSSKSYTLYERIPT